MRVPGIRSLSEFTRVGDKESGIEAGGIYILEGDTSNQKTKYYIKKMDTDSTMRELVGSAIARTILGDANAPETFLLKNEHDNILIASREIPDFITMSGFLQQTGIPENCFPNGCVTTEKGDIIPITSYMLSFENEYNESHEGKVYIFENAMKFIRVVNFVDHGDFHSGNYGLVNEGNKVALIDFSRSLRRPGLILSPNPSDKLLNIVEIDALLEVNHAFEATKVFDAIQKCRELLADAWGNDDAFKSELDYIIENLEKAFQILEKEVQILNFVLKSMQGHTIKTIPIPPKNSNEYGGISTSVLNTYYNQIFVILSSPDLLSETTKNALIAALDYKFASSEFIITSFHKVFGSTHIITNKLTELVLSDDDLKLQSLNLALKENNIQLVNFLLENGADITAVDYAKRTALHLAAENGNIELAEFLIKKGANVNDREQSGYTPLHYAIKYGYIEFAKFLITNHGAIITAVDYTKRTALHYAAESGDIELAEFLIARGASVNAIDYTEKTTLHYAAERGHIGMAKFLITKEVDVNAVDYTKKTALHFAAENGHIGMAEFLITNEADVNAVNNSGKTALHLATENGHIKVAISLIAKMTNVNAVDYAKRTALHYATGKGHIQLAEALLARGADVNAVDKGGNTALHNAIKEGHIEFAKFLIARSADVNAVDEGGNTALHYAIKEGHIEFAKFLIARGADVNAVSGYEKTALHLAAEKGHIELAETLIARGVDVNVIGGYRKTALHLAAEKGHIEFAKFLIARGADVNVVDGYGKTALYYAIENGAIEITNLIESHIKVQAEKAALEAAKQSQHEAKPGKSFLQRLNEATSLPGAAAKAIQPQNNQISTNVQPQIQSARSQFVLSLGIDSNNEINLPTLSYFNDTLTLAKVIRFKLEQLDNWLRERRTASGVDNDENKVPLSTDNKASKDKYIMPQSSTTVSKKKLNKELLSKQINKIKLLHGEARKTLLHKEDEDGNTILHLAAMQGYSDLFGEIMSLEKTMEDKLAHFEKPNNAGYSALHMAIINGHLHLVKDVLHEADRQESKDKDVLFKGFLLLARGGSNSDTALHLAAKENRTKIMDVILESLPKTERSYYITAVNSDNVSPLHIAIASENLEMVRMIFKHLDEKSIPQVLATIPEKLLKPDSSKLDLPTQNMREINALLGDYAAKHPQFGYVASLVSYLQSAFNNEPIDIPKDKANFKQSSQQQVNTPPPPPQKTR